MENLSGANRVQMKKILLVGNINKIDVNFLYKLVCHVKKKFPELYFDLYNLQPIEEEKAKEPFECVYECRPLFPNFFYRIKGVASLARILDSFFSFKKLNNYSVVNAHYLGNHSTVLLRIFGEKFGDVVLSPWGSDIYREKKFLSAKKKLFKQADYITVFDDNPMKKDIIETLDLRKIDQFEDIGFGSDVIEHLCRKDFSMQEAAKRKLGLDSQYVIVCGYNGSAGQQHIEIINAIYSVRDKFPDDVVFLFPMTYGATEHYLKNVEEKLSTYKLPYRIYVKFFSVEQLAHLRKAADIFIHAQVTDAFSASVQEHILAGTTVINASWVSYPGLEKYGKPYVLFDSFDDLGPALISVIEGTANYEVSEQLLQEIRDKSWTVVAEKWGEFYKRLISSTS